MTDPLDRRTFTSLGLASTTALLSSGSGAAERGGSHPRGIRKDQRTTITILLYPGTTILDWIGPCEALAWVPEVDVVLAGKSTDLMKNDRGAIDYKANVMLDQIERTDVLIVPGGAKGLIDATNDPIISSWVRKIDMTTIYTVGICTGALMLSHLGLLKGRRATTYWKFTGLLAKDNAIFDPTERWVKDGKYWTSGGVSAGIDATLALIGDLYGTKAAMKAQLGIEYDPRPPYNAGSIHTAPLDVINELGGIVS
ncbi:MAG: DJ-1/PfpI family protein [Sphingopyxis terrae]|nr:DJ-1/PfpI family protein [Sphingopyxis terrae]